MTIAEKIAALKRKRQEALQAAKAVQKMGEKREDGPTDEHLAEIEGYLKEAEDLKGEITALEEKAQTLASLENLEAEMNTVEPSRTRQTGSITEPDAVTSGQRDAWMDDPKKGFKSEADFFGQVLKISKQPEGVKLPGPLAYLATDKDGVSRYAAAGSDEQSTFSEPHGGFFVPEGFSPNLLELGAEMDPMAGRVTNIPMDFPTVNIPARVDKDHSNSVSGGLRFYRRAEADQASSSRAVYENIKLEASGLQGIAYCTEELLRDSPRSFAAIIAAGFQMELVNKLIDERLNGTGAGEYMGINNNPALITVSKETGQGADTVVFQNIVKMLARCWNRSRAIWLYNDNVLPSLMTMKNDNGQLIWQGSAREGEPDRILGKPAFPSEYLETVGDAGDLHLGVWSEYLEGTYQPLEGSESIHVRFLQNERTFKFYTRNAGAPWWRSVLTPKNGDTLAPFVRLAARA